MIYNDLVQICRAMCMLPGGVVHIQFHFLTSFLTFLVNHMAYIPPLPFHNIHYTPLPL